MIYLLYLFYYGKIENGSSQTDAKKHIIHHYRGVKGVELQLHLAKIQNCLVLFSSSSFFFVVYLVGQNSNKSVAAALMIFEVRRPEMRGAKCTCQKPLCPRFGLLLLLRFLQPDFK